MLFTMLSVRCASARSCEGSLTPIDLVWSLAPYERFPGSFRLVACLSSCWVRASVIETAVSVGFQAGLHSISMVYYCIQYMTT